MNNSKGNVAILGGSGFVGGYLCNRLAAAGYDNTVFTRDADSAKASKLLLQTSLVELDPYNRAALAGALRGHDVVINLVGILNERGFSGKGFRRAHVELTQSVIAVMQTAGIRRYLHMSALRAGEGKSHYLQSRGEAEALVRDSGLDWTIFRPSVIFGRGDSFLNRFAGLLKISPVLPLACPGSRFQPVWVMDVANAFVAALGDERSIGRCYELGGPEIHTLKEIVTMVRDWLAIRRPIIGLPKPLAWLQGHVMDFVPGKPFSSDNYKSLLVDNVIQGDNGLPELGIEPHSMTAVAPLYIGGSRRRRLLDRLHRTARR